MRRYIKTTIVSILSLIMVWVFVGCRTNSSLLTDSTIYNPDVSDDIVDESKVYIAVGPGVTLETLDCVNEYLAKSGCDYSIEYVHFGKSSSQGTYSPVDYCNDVINYINSGKQLDICYTSTLFVNNLDMLSYDYLVEQNVLEPMDEYLGSDRGQALYESIPAARWESIKRNGRIYGVSGGSSEVCTSPAFIFNKSMLAKYGYSEADVNCSVKELAGIIKTISEGESQNPRFTAIAWTEGCNRNWKSLYNPNSKLRYFGINPEGKVECIYRNAEYMAFLKDIWGLASDSNTSISILSRQSFNDCLMTVSCWAIPWFNPITEQGYAEESGSYEELMVASKNYYVTYPYGFSMDIIKPCHNNNCIIAQSKNKERAYDFLTRAYSDKAFTDIILYGNEGVSYEIVDGVIAISDVDGKLYPTNPYGMILLGNAYLSIPSTSENPDKERLVQELSGKMHTFDFNGYFYKLSDNITLYNKISKVCSKFISKAIKAEDFNSFYEEFLIELSEAGAEELIDNVQRDFDEWRKAQ